MAMSSHGGKRLLTVVLDFASFNLYMKTNSTLRSYFQAYTYLGKHLNYFIFDDKPKVWQYELWSFQAGGTKLERVLPKNPYAQRKLLNFENWVNG